MQFLLQEFFQENKKQHHIACTKHFGLMNNCNMRHEVYVVKKGKAVQVTGREGP
jgi:hypothetical protein